MLCSRDHIDPHHAHPQLGSVQMMDAPASDSKAMAHQQPAAAAAAAVGPQRCPRCDSANTKFCYYNNYSLSQPRHFCKACKRYWTRGGSLRNVPVGGGCRKNKRSKKPAPARSRTQQPQPADLSSFFYASSAMNLGFGAAGGLISDSNPSSSINASLANIQHQTVSPYSYFDNEYSSILASSIEQYHQTLMPYDGLLHANLGFLKEVKLEGDGGLIGGSGDFSADQWGAGNYAFEAIGGGDASCLEYWNPAMGGGGGWLDAANPSLAPLI